MLLKSVLLISCLVAGISGHGRLLDPPARSSAWREDPVRFPMYYDDNQMFCGGFFTQWTTHSRIEITFYNSFLFITSF
jgi:hypothetical protein